MPEVPIITDSINGNTGVVGVNQDSGNLVNQGNSLALSNVEPAGDDRLVVHAEAAELAFVEAGWGVNRRAVMINDFLIVGPGDDIVLAELEIDPSTICCIVPRKFQRS